MHGGCPGVVARSDNLRLRLGRRGEKVVIAAMSIPPLLDSAYEPTKARHCARRRRRARLGPLRRAAGAGRARPRARIIAGARSARCRRRGCDRQIETLEEWVRAHSRTDVLKLLDARFRGGIIEAKAHGSDRRVASDQRSNRSGCRTAPSRPTWTTGREVWLREGSMLESRARLVRAAGAVLSDPPRGNAGSSTAAS